MSLSFSSSIAFAYSWVEASKSLEKGGRKAQERERERERERSCEAKVWTSSAHTVRTTPTLRGMKRKKEEKELHLVHLVHLLPQQALSMSMVKTAAPVSCQEEQEEDGRRRSVWLTSWCLRRN